MLRNARHEWMNLRRCTIREPRRKAFIHASLCSLSLIIFFQHFCDIIIAFSIFLVLFSHLVIWVHSFVYDLLRKTIFRLSVVNHIDDWTLIGLIVRWLHTSADFTFYVYSHACLRGWNLFTYLFIDWKLTQKTNNLMMTLSHQKLFIIVFFPSLVLTRSRFTESLR